MKFFDRRRELKQLNDFYRRPRAGLLIIYGRRRVGKTSLLSHWLDQVAAQHKLPASTSLFWTATTQGIQYQLRDFSQAVIRLDPRLPAPPAPDYSFPTWDAAFGYLADLAAMQSAKSPFVVVIDEFTYLVQSDPSIVSLLQRVWDHRLSRAANLRLVLSGSLVDIMEKKVLSAQSPLYGRATSLLRLHPLPFGTLAELFPAWSSAERVALYSVCGGVPSYLALFDGAPSFVRGLREGALAPGSLMFSDAALLLNERLTDPFVYSSVLGSIASGYHIWTEIAKMAGVPETNLGITWTHSRPSAWWSAAARFWPGPAPGGAGIMYGIHSCGSITGSSFHTGRPSSAANWRESRKRLPVTCEPLLALMCLKNYAGNGYSTKPTGAGWDFYQRKSEVSGRSNVDSPFSWMWSRPAAAANDY
jgi:AAA+ ATPase superfamily predicted ATPase